MLVSLVVAATLNGVIGNNGGLPWRLPNDLAYFKQLTLGHHIVMGRKTFKSLPKRKPLPGRTNLIISRQANFQATGFEVVDSLAAALQLAEQSGETECFVIGGEQIFRLALPLAHRIYLTRIETTLEGDTFFPTLDWNNWQLMSQKAHPADERHPYPYAFTVWERKTF